MLKQIVELPQNYKPSEDEEYMNPFQLEYFRQKLLGWKDALQKELMNAASYLKEENWNNPDFNDRAAVEADAGLELRTKDRYRKLIAKIDDALLRIENMEYGYCEETDKPIGLKRLEARPVATLSIEAQEKHEKFERTHSEE